jgi:hypothetical protein
MHTSTRMGVTDFQFWQQGPTGAQPTDFATFCPDYHELDRVGVVSPTLEAGVYQTSYALLALTTAFYDRLRTRGDDFFDYPQHFAFVGAAGTDICTSNGLLAPDTSNLWHAWSWLDLWPDNKWVTAPATATALLQRVFDYQINRLFWPRSLTPGANEATLPPHVWKMLRTRLKAVYYYGDVEPTETEPPDEQIEIRVSPAVDAVVQESLALLPEGVEMSQTMVTSQCYTVVRVEDFLKNMHTLIDLEKAR